MEDDNFQNCVADYYPAKAVKERFDCAVVITTIGRASLVDALKSVFLQDINGVVQILIGYDIVKYDNAKKIRELIEQRPDNFACFIFRLPYSTSQRHSGLHRARDGGATRTILSYIANSPLIAYLDDDNTWEPNHLSSLKDVINGFAWAFSLRMFVDQETGQALCVDQWDSVGPGKGIRKESLGGFVDPNCLMIDKTKAEFALSQWALLLGPEHPNADRRVFVYLVRHHSVAWTNLATANYSIRRTFFLWPEIKQKIFQSINSNFVDEDTPF